MRPSVLWLMFGLTACVSVADLARQSAVHKSDTAPLEVFRTLRVEPGTHTDAVTSLAVDRNERLLLSGSADKTARLWAVADGKPRGTLRPPIGEGDRGKIQAVSLSADGHLAAIGGVSAGARPDAVLVFDTKTFRVIARLIPRRRRGLDARVDQLAFLGGGDRLAVHYAPNGGTALFDAAAGTELNESRDSSTVSAGDPPRELRLRNGRRITGDGTGRITMTDSGGHIVWDIAPAALEIESLALSNDGSTIRISGPKGPRVFSVAAMDKSATWSRGPRAVIAGAPIRVPDGSFLRADGSRLVRATASGELLWADTMDSGVKAIAASATGGIVVAALGDGTLRWLDGASGAERLALYLTPKGGWVAWTPDGFFDHSDSAWNLAGWHVNRGPRHAAEFVKLGQLYDVAYRPDLIRQAYAGHSKTAAAIRSGDAIDPANRLALGLPPQVKVSAEPTVDHRRAVVQADVQERGGGLGKVLYRVNGVVVALDHQHVPPGSGATIHLTRTVPLRNGPNQIEVDALDAASQLESAPAVASIAEGKAAPRQGQLWAVVVGINDYADPRMRLKFAKPDAEAIAAALSQVAGLNFTAVHIATLFDGDARTAELGRTVKAFSDQMTDADTFILYLSGHGFNLRGRYEFITYDVRAPTIAQIAEHSLSQDALQDLLAAVPAGRAVVVLDTCYAGGAITLDDSNLMIRDADRRLARATGRSVLAAATSTEEALEGYHDHGVLTYALLQGMHGDAAGGDNVITVRELGDYTLKQVPLIAAQVFKARQIPVFTLVGKDIVLARSSVPRQLK